MEKHERFADLRRGIIPKNLNMRFNGVSKLILQMTDVDVNNRPSAENVIKIIQSEILRLENNTLGLGVSDVLTQRNRFYSYDTKDVTTLLHCHSEELSYTLQLLVESTNYNSEVTTEIN
jgi:hypothetical protein